MQDIGHHLWTRCRDVSAALIASLWRGRDFGQVVAWIDQNSPQMQRGIVFGTLAGLFGLSLVAAQFGLLGLCIYWLLVIWLIR